ncbi:tetratricopeptide repeat protein [Demetria terragena]|uniref:tetratricopeptide repeat protein n=1 Tax=Demetria terragena TaxID=63959 RepID=UPI000372CB7B|nr:hypothetical protein [Demetria terragena]
MSREEDAGKGSARRPDDGRGERWRRASGRDNERQDSPRSRDGRSEERRTSASRPGPRSWDRGPRPKDGGPRREPVIPEDITGQELDRSVWREMRTLSKENAEGVAQHLVATVSFLDDDPDRALEHAQTAARRAGRVAAVREGLGLVHYRRGEFSDALREFRTARRLSGSHHLLPYMADCERGLGRPQRALDLAASPEAKTLGEEDNIELAIVVSGARRDLGQPDAAVMVLRIPALQKANQQPWAARLLYAYADAVLATGKDDEAQEWFSRAVVADQNQETDAAERLAELQGVVLEDLDDGEDLDDAEPADDETE